MDQPSFLSRSGPIALSNIFNTEQKILLPLPAHQKPRLRVRALLSHCLYRRVILWTVGILVLLCILLTQGGARLRGDRFLNLVEYQQDGEDSNGDPKVVFVVTAGSEKPGTPAWGINMPNWLRFRHLDGYFTGLKALVSSDDYKPEYPLTPGEESPFPLTLSYTGLPTPTPFVPQPDYESLEYTTQYHEVEPCYLDEEKKVPVPDLYAYNGLVQGQPEPVIGSHNVLGLRDDICFDRFGRYGPYGLGYSFDEGGSEVGLDTEREGSEAVWEKTGKINYNTIDWGDVQTRCYEANKKRFDDANEQANPSPTVPNMDPRRSFQHHVERKRIPRTAIVVRAYTGFPWSEHAILNFRAMISETALRSGGEYAVHFLLHVRDDREAIWADPITAQRVLDDNLPQEFHSLATLWSEAQMRLVYPVKFGRSIQDPSGADIHGVYRSAHMALQNFAMSRPEYTHFWNWELDIRYTGNYYELFDRLGAWSEKQSRIELWERSAKYYIPHYHQDWANFTSVVRNETASSSRTPIFGPVSFPGRTPLRSELRGENFLPSSCAPQNCGVGEDADLITFNPLFDPDESGWVFASDVTGYKGSQPTPPRRCAIVTASRLSRRLLEVMHEENWRLHHTMFSEMFPATMALHHGLKAVYAPHPVYLDREWDLDAIDKSFNGGRDHSTSGHGSPFDYNNEHNHKGTTWYYNSEFAGLLWRRWLGYAQLDGRGPNGGRSGEGKLRGGEEEESNTTGTGRLCLRSMLLHPIKWEHPSELE
ncbi:hypothetical protein BT67DRAFT_446813 [Trichocladium antarcticum]|uniref:Major facilitator superfamily transporter n=1 Tax=Trichocladium antarcticum TaxID=1450529 RepID=A0AAN6ZI65_9PEZI|nr:hypothetical protein BT67DRAFT_446813 [Trichocladium antarcticum]